jgi:hypothetical protein
MIIEREVYESLKKSLSPAYRELMEHLVKTGEYKIVDSEGAAR